MIKTNKRKILFWIVFLAGTLARLLFLGKIPGGLHCDEALAGYEAYSLLHFGVDSWGYRNPVYFVSWGGGMNVLESYLMIPFIAIGGLNELTIRIPQAVFSVISLVVIYKLLMKIANEKYALITMFVMAISPWHIMFSRWGCESNLCPAMILLGTYFLVLSFEKIIKKTGNPTGTLALSAFFWGLDLYCYAATWIPVAVVLLVWALYLLLYCKKNNIKFEKREIVGIVVFILILFVMAAPLLLFIMINLDKMGEICSFISIPKMVLFRIDEIMDWPSIKNRIHYFAHILVVGEDGRPWNSILPYRLFYTKISIPVVFIGVGYAIRNMVKEIKGKRFSYSFMLVSYSVIATVLVILQRVDIICSNYLQISLLFYWGLGIYAFAKLAKGRVVKGMVLAYLIGFVLFMHTYFTEFKEQINQSLMSGAGDAIHQAVSLREELKADKIFVSDSLSHALVLFYTEYPVQDFIDTVTWKVYPDRYMAAKSLGEYVWVFDDDYIEGNVNLLQNQNDGIAQFTNVVYILNDEELEQFDPEQWDIEKYDNTYVVYYKE